MYKRFFKRFSDILFSLIGLIFFAFIFLVFAPIIRGTDKGPIFYNAPRIGKNGRIFKMYKLRSMYVNSPDIRLEDGSTYNGNDDPRVTKIGRFMRKTSIDETPQLLNVLKGEMSLVGPRAYVASGYNGYDTLDDNSKHRLSVLPGITGYNQAYFRNSVSAEKKFKNDLYYVDNLTFAMDVRVIFKTIVSVIKHENIFIEKRARAHLCNSRGSEKN